MLPGPRGQDRTARGFPSEQSYLKAAVAKLHDIYSRVMVARSPSGLSEEGASLAEASGGGGDPDCCSPRSADDLGVGLDGVQRGFLPGSLAGLELSKRHLSLCLNACVNGGGGANESRFQIHGINVYMVPFAQVKFSDLTEECHS